MPAKLLDEAQPVNVFLGRVTQHMKPYQPAPKLAVIASGSGTHPRKHISWHRKMERVNPFR